MKLDRRWTELEAFPGYQMSDLAEFVNARTDREVTPSRTQQGHAKVTLMRDGRPTTRAVAPLVAEQFVEKLDPSFDTPIHLNGDLMDCRAANLMWRPRWFAIRYHKQFLFDQFHIDQQPRIDVDTNEVYDSLKEVCTRNGLYYMDVLRVCTNGGVTPITHQEFRVMQM